MKKLFLVLKANILLVSCSYDDKKHHQFNRHES